MSLASELVAIVGCKNVLIGQGAISAYLRKGWPFSTLPLPKAIVFPHNSAQVQCLMSLANKLRIPVTPVSSRIHLHPGAQPLHGGLVVDLRNMNKIEDLDPRNRKVKIQAGVTWNQLHEFLTQEAMVTTTPLLPHPQASVLSSFLDREPTVDARFETREPIASLEMVWPTGELFRTGTASHVGYGANSAAGAYPYGPGPIDPLRLLQGAQGTMGIATWANIRLEPRPAMDEAIVIPVGSHEKACQILSYIQKRKIGRECFALNRVMMLRTIAKRLGITPEHIGNALPHWLIFLIISAGNWFPEEKIGYEKDALMSLISEFDIGAKEIEAMSWVFHSRGLAEALRSPWREDGTHWALGPQGAWPRLFFISPLNKASTLVDLMTGMMEQNPDADLGIYIQPLEYGGGAHLDFIFFTSSVMTSREQIEQLFGPWTVSLIQSGAHFSRPHGEAVSKAVYETIDPGYTKVLEQIKTCLDPNHILNPGRLCFELGNVGNGQS